MKKNCVFFLLVLLAAGLFADSDEKLKLAVMEFEDRSGNLSEKTLSDATEYVRGAFVSTNKYVVIAKERQEKAMIKEMKKESYKSCNDKNCQIPLGQALSADTILRTTITFFGGSYTITSELIDLAKEATVIGAKEDYDGSEAALKAALDKIVEKITGYVEKHDDEIIRAETAEVKQEEPKAEEVKKSEPVEEKHAENIHENQPTKEVAEEPEKKAEVQEKPEPENKDPENTYHPYTKVGASLMVVGLAVVVAGVAGFHVASDKEFNKYLDMKNYTTAEDAVSSGMSHSEYMNKAKNHREKSNTYKALEITSGAIGAAVVVTGLVLASIKKEKPQNDVALSNISFAPSNDGFYAAVGFEF